MVVDNCSSVECHGGMDWELWTDLKFQVRMNSSGNVVPDVMRKECVEMKVCDWERFEDEKVETKEIVDTSSELLTVGSAKSEWQITLAWSHLSSLASNSFSLLFWLLLGEPVGNRFFNMFASSERPKTSLILLQKSKYYLPYPCTATAPVLSATCILGQNPGFK